MTNMAENSMEELEALLEERSKFERWLAQLDARRATTPVHVFERVHGDYAGRLAVVSEQLASRATELHATAASLAEQINALFETVSTRRDERAEAELRAAVGEYTEAHAAEIYARCDEEIGTVEARRASLGAELARVQEVLAESARPSVIPDAAPAPEPEVAHVVEAEAMPAAPAAPEVVPVEAHPTVEPSHAAAAAASHGNDEHDAARTPAHAAAPGAPAPGAFDDLAFLQSIAEPRPARASDAAAPRADRHAAGAADHRGQGGHDGYIVPPSLASVRHAGSGGAREPGAPLQPTLTPGSLPAFIKEMPT